MKILAFIVVFICFIFSANAQYNAQENYLTIAVLDIKGNIHEKICYPTGTTFTAESSSVKTDNESAYTYQGDVTLRVKPSYAPQKENVYSYQNMTVQVFTTTKAAELAGYTDTMEDYGKATKNHQRNSPSEEVTAKKIVTPSNNILGQYNLSLAFSNGLNFSYEDGKIEAEQSGKALPINGRYLIESESGIAKVSFNPANGETWWVFDKSDN